MTYEEYLASVKSIKKPATDAYKPIKQFSKKIWEEISGNDKAIIDTFKQFGITVYRDTAGKVIGYSKDIDTYTGQSGSDSGDYSNSNNAPSSSHNSRKLQAPYDIKVETDSNGNVNVLGRLLPFGQLGLDYLFDISGVNKGINNLALNTYLGTIGCSVSGLLGYNIRNELYKNNPDIFGGIDPQKIDYTDYYPIVGNFFNLLMGTNPDTGESTMYMRDDDLAAVALKLSQTDLFATVNKASMTEEEVSKFSYLKGPTSIPYMTIPAHTTMLLPSTHGWESTVVNDLDVDLYITCVRPSDTFDYDVLIFTNDNRYLYRNITSYERRISDGYGDREYIPRGQYTFTVFGESVRVGTGLGYTVHDNGVIINVPKTTVNAPSGYYPYMGDVVYLILHGNKGLAPTLPGVTYQENAVRPDFSNINISGSTPIQDTKNYINELYPDIYKNRITIPVNQPDGTTKEIVYYPVPIPVLPDTTSDSSDNVNAVSGNSNQINITNITNIFPESHSIPTIVDPEPPSIDTGTGIVPPIILPTGSADAMFTAYNPTLQQVQSFGAWLWSGNPIEQIKKLFFNPVDAIISLHKVYISPVANNEGTIHLGYLDSNVPSKILTNQSNMFNFGIISLPEYFGNVFDYDPFTEVSIYLPFVGIVPLNVKDIMRSSLQVIYQCDMYTGNIMAQVNVLRDGNNGGTLYTYPGNCAEHFPVSAGDISGTISSSLNIGMGLSQTISGNPAFGISQFARGVFSPKGSTQRSGDFSGNVGSLGNRSAYLIISRPQIMLADNFPAYQGKPTNYTTTVGACSGFIKCKVDHIENVNATDSELTEIDTLLQQGILV